MKNKILIILVICVLGLFWDDLAMRVARLEYQGQDEISQRARLERLEKEAAKIPKLEAQLNRAQEQLILLNPSAAKSNLVEKRLLVFQQFFEKMYFADHGIKTFTTSRDIDRIENVEIVSQVAQQNVNWGKRTFFRMGTSTVGNTGRALLRFKDLTPGLFAGKKILTAVLYIQQIPDQGAIEDDAAVNETIDLYAVTKNWAPGRNAGGKAAKREATWISARAEEEDWAVPGCGSPTEDFEPALLATSGPVVSGDAGEWVPLIFNKDGISRLQDKEWTNKGFFLRMADESRIDTAVLFYSAKANADHMPYLEIYYVEEAPKAP